MNIPHMEDTYDPVLVNGVQAFGMIPGGYIEGLDEAMPIHLYRGNLSFGHRHIEHRHGRWVASKKMSVAELVWRKCRQPGNIYLAPADKSNDTKLSILLPVTPGGLLVLTHVPKLACWSVTSLYYKEGTVSGTELGRYEDTLPQDWGDELVFRFAHEPDEAATRVRRRGPRL